VWFARGVDVPGRDFALREANREFLGSYVLDKVQEALELRYGGYQVVSVAEVGGVNRVLVSLYRVMQELGLEDLASEDVVLPPSGCTVPDFADEELGYKYLGVFPPSLQMRVALALGEEPTAGTVFLTAAALHVFSVSTVEFPLCGFSQSEQTGLIEFVDIPGSTESLDYLTALPDMGVRCRGAVTDPVAVWMTRSDYDCDGRPLPESADGVCVEKGLLHLSDVEEKVFDIFQFADGLAEVDEPVPYFCMFLPSGIGRPSSCLVFEMERGRTMHVSTPYLRFKLKTPPPILPALPGGWHPVHFGIGIRADMWGDTHEGRWDRLINAEPPPVLGYWWVSSLEHAVLRGEVLLVATRLQNDNHLTTMECPTTHQLGPLEPFGMTQEWARLSRLMTRSADVRVLATVGSDFVPDTAAWHGGTWHYWPAVREAVLGLFGPEVQEFYEDGSHAVSRDVGKKTGEAKKGDAGGEEKESWEESYKALVKVVEREGRHVKV